MNLSWMDTRLFLAILLVLLVYGESVKINSHFKAELSTVLQQMSHCHISILFNISTLEFPLREIFTETFNRLQIPTKIFEPLLFSKDLNQRGKNLGNSCCRTKILITSSDTKTFNVFDAFELYKHKEDISVRSDIFVVVSYRGHLSLINFPERQLLPTTFLIIQLGLNINKNLKLKVLSQNCGRARIFCVFPVLLEELVQKGLRNVAKAKRKNFFKASMRIKDDFIQYEILTNKILKANRRSYKSYCKYNNKVNSPTYELTDVLARKHNFTLNSRPGYSYSIVPKVSLVVSFEASGNALVVFEKFMSFQIVYAEDVLEGRRMFHNLVQPFQTVVWLVLFALTSLVTLYVKKLISKGSYLDALGMSFGPWLNRSLGGRKLDGNFGYTCYFLMISVIVTGFYLCQLQSTMIVPESFQSHKNLKELLQEGYKVAVGHPDKFLMDTYLHYFIRNKVNAVAMLEHQNLVDNLVLLPDVRKAKQYTEIYGGKKSCSITDSTNLFALSKIHPALFNNNFFYSKEKFFVLPIVWYFRLHSADILSSTLKLLQSTGITQFWDKKLEQLYQEQTYTNLKGIYKNEIQSKKFRGESLRTFDTGNIHRVKPLSADDDVLQNLRLLYYLGNVVAILSIICESCVAWSGDNNVGTFFARLKYVFKGINNQENFYDHIFHSGKQQLLALKMFHVWRRPKGKIVSCHKK
ncbi:unnamed protein product [Allacma fusca]|uniref:Uncharacterized protein n=1 Tax=Allacma fusca TaxID=39272 RepID=A0A8J2NHK5_9HEXA|nr:unnamed protein product [Allacma fusca]